MKRILIVDGNYFAMRSLGQVNMGDQINNLETKQEREDFRTCLNVGLVSLFEDWKPFTENIIFAFDNNSWRKKIQPIKPFWITDNRPIGYKDNRTEKKEESPIDYDVFYEILNDFKSDVKTILPTFDIPGLEGDDIIMLLSSAFKDDVNKELIIFCTDGDLMQVVRDNCMLFRNIKSKESPNGEFVMNQKMFVKSLPKEINKETAFLQSTLELNFYSELFKFKNYKERKLNTGLTLAYPFKMALIKSVCGDKKDNIFSILGWKASTGSREYKLSEKMLEEALSKMGIEHFIENTAVNIFTKKENLEKLVTQLISDKAKEIVSTKYFMGIKPDKSQLEIKINELKADKEFFKTVMAHLYHNIKLIMLSLPNLPKELITEFNLALEGQLPIIDIKLDVNVFNRLNVNKRDNNINTLKDSLPDGFK